MKSRLVLVVTTGAVMVAPMAAHAFPEQPGTHPATACQAVLNSGTATAFGAPFVPNGRAGDKAETRVDARYVDACLGGP